MEGTTYIVGGFPFEIAMGDFSPWERLRGRFRPFRADDPVEPQLSIQLAEGPLPSTEGMELVFNDEAAGPDELRINLWRTPVGESLFTIQYPGRPAPTAALLISSDSANASLTVDTTGIDPRMAEIVAASGLQLAYILATIDRHLLMAHASCVLNGGKAYLFLGRSGTGKSTHARLWLKHVPCSRLLNDDHPIVRIEGGRATAYGSPWSGKTPCYLPDSAPIGAIVRIKQAPYNKIARLESLQAFASLLPSFSGLSFCTAFAQARNALIEALAQAVPCYQLECLPDQEAAEVCSCEVRVKNGVKS